MSDPLKEPVRQLNRLSGAVFLGAGILALISAGIDLWMGQRPSPLPLLAGILCLLAGITLRRENP